MGRRLSVVLWLTTAVGAIAIVGGASTEGTTLGGGPLVLAVAIFGVIALLFASTGAIIESRRPGNRVGWVMIACGPILVATFGGFLFGAIRGATHGPEDRVGGLIAWIGTMGVAPAVYLLGPLLATIFPDGRLPGPRWRAVVLLTSATVVATDVFAAFLPGPLQSGLPDNPLGFLPSGWAPALRTVSDLLLTGGFLAGMAMAATAVTVRFRRSSGPEREQMKWFLVAILAVAATTPLSAFDGAPTTSVFDFALIVSIAAVPISVGIAVTRYRLYEIDTIINRALVYGLLTAILAGGSAAAIGVAQRAFEGVVGRGSDVTIVLTTLVVVTAFNPLKTRLQAMVDSRFKEARDPASVLRTFTDTLSGSPWRPDRDRSLALLLRTALSAIGAEGGRLRVRREGAQVLEFTEGVWEEEGSESVRLSAAGMEVDLSLTGHRRGPLSPEDRAVLEQAIAAVLRETGADAAAG